MSSINIDMTSAYTYAKSIISSYLYTSANVPEYLFSQKYIRDMTTDSDGIVSGIADKALIDSASYMSGAGRFATGANNKLVNAFFDESNANFAIMQPGSYEKGAVFETLFGGEGGYSTVFNAYNYSDGTDDIAERVVIFGS